MSIHTESLRVLVVDDEKLIVESMAMILKVKGYEARVAYSAEDAIVAAEVFRPHVVISDVVMGVMTGIDLAIHLANEHPECKVLLISGKAVALDLIEEANQRVLQSLDTEQARAS
jgi:YesN/AraC family two-component response regulator